MPVDAVEWFKHRSYDYRQFSDLEALGRRKVEPETFARALNLFGRQGIVNVVSLMSHYAATAVLLTTFDQQLRPGQAPLLPMP